MKPSIFRKSSIFFAITIVVISIMAWALVDNYSDYFDRVHTEYKEKEIIDLSKPISVERLSEFLIQKGYLDNEEERLKIAEAGRDFVIKNYTMKKLLAYVLKKDGLDE